MTKIIRIIKVTLGGLAFLSLLSIIFIMLTIFYIKDHERNFPIVSFAINTFNLFEQDIEVRFSSSKIRFDSAKSEFIWRIEGLKIEDEKNKNPLLNVNEVGMGLNILNIASSKNILRKIVLDSPNFYVYGTENHKIVHQEFDKINHFKELTKLSKHIINLFGVKIKVTNGFINFVRADKNIVWHIDNLQSMRTDKYYRINGQALFNDHISNFELGANIKDVQSEVALKFYNFPYIVAAELINNDFLKSIFSEYNKNLMANGSANILITDEPDIKYIDAQIESIRPEKIEDVNDLPIVSENKIKITYRDNFINFDEVSFKFQNDGEFSFSSKIDLDKNSSLENVNIVSNTKNLPVETAKLLWPNHLLPEVRNWLVSNLNHGKISEASVNIKDFELKNDKAILDDKFKAEIVFEKVGINKFSYLPEFKNIDGIAEFSSKSVRIKFGNAELEDIKLSNSILNILFEDENKNSILSLQGKVNGPVKSYNSLIPEELFKLSKYKIDLNNSNGNVNGDFNLTLPIIDNLETKNINYEANLKVSNANIFKSFPKYILKTDNLNIKHINNDFNLSSKGIISKLPYDINISFPDKEIENKVIATLYINNNNYNLIDPKHKYFELIHGNIPITLEDVGGKIKISADLIGAQLNFDTINYRKSIGSKLKLSCISEIKENMLNIENIFVVGDNIKIENGKASINQDLVISNLDIKKIKIANNLFNLSVINNLSNRIIKINGSRLDLSRLDISNLRNNDDQNINNNIEIKLDKIIMKNEIEYNDPYLKIECNHGKICKNIVFNANLEDEHFIKIKNSKVSELSEEINIYSDNAAAFLKSLNLYTNIYGGKKFIASVKREIESQSKKDNFTTKYSGKIEFYDFESSKNSTITMIILALTSPFSSGKTHEKGNILMNSFKMDFTEENGIISVKNGNAIGSSLQLTLDGIIDTNKKALDLRGNFIPSVLGINAAISKLPLFRKGKAVIAATYRINGNFDEPQVSINPLSILTPGFLRGIFN